MPSHSALPARRSWLPPAGSPGYHALLVAVAVLVLGPLGGITAAYMNFSLGFFVGGQVLAGILGSAVTYGYGADGKHGANYRPTAWSSASTDAWPRPSAAIPQPAATAARTASPPHLSETTSSLPS